MNKNEAKELLSFHSTRNEDIDSCFMFLLENDVEDAFIIDYEDYLNGAYSGL